MLGQHFGILVVCGGMGNQDLPAFWTCSSRLACSRMDLMASSEPLSVVRIRVVMLPRKRKRTWRIRGEQRTARSLRVDFSTIP